MIKAILHRQSTTEQGTFGVLQVGTRRWFSLELPWRGNRHSISCIPCGTYECFVWSSKKYPEAYVLKDVHGRTAILIHSGNFAGDVLKGWATHSKGCILLGTKRGVLGKQQAVFSSKTAIRQFLKLVNGQKILLEIRGDGYA